MSGTMGGTVVAPPPPPGDDVPPRRPTRVRELRGTAIITALSLLLALVVGGVLIAASDEQVRASAGYFFSRPTDLLEGAWTAVRDAYTALFRGAVFNYQGDTLAQMVRPITESLVFATPLIAAGLAVALAFKAGLFNIGAEGQIIVGAILAGYVGFAWDLPLVAHLLVAVAAGLVGGALWGGIAGVLKARTGAHEVIVTIMLNYIARFLLAWLLTQEAFQREGRNDPISPIVEESAQYPALLGAQFRLHWGLLFALAAAAAVWWLLNRSVLGFRLRAVGANPSAARTAGIGVGSATTLAMVLAGGLAGLAGTAQVLGTERTLTGGVSAGIGFDAITVALLGRASPVGVVLAGLLFGALRAGGIAMQAQTGTPVDIIFVLQALIVLFIAAPPLVRSVFRIRTHGGGTLQVAKGWNA